jgi:hypothetical protein
VHGFITSPTVSPQYRNSMSIISGFLNEWSHFVDGTIPSLEYV